MKGICGLKKDIKKAMKLFKRAADLGDADAQNKLAFHYFHGYRDSDTTKECCEKARYYAEKAADQGAAYSQFILARLLIMESDCNRDEEVFRLLTLAAFEGHQNARGTSRSCIWL